MKKIAKLFAVAFAFVAAASCQDRLAVVDGIQGETELVTCTFEASMPETKAALNGLEVLWQEGDKIAIYLANTAGDKYEFTLQSGAGTKNAKFVGQLPADNTTGWYALYPYSAAGEKGAFTVPAEQNIAAGSTADPAALIMTFGSKGSSKSYKLKTIDFTNACGIARMTVPEGTTNATFCADGVCYSANLAAASGAGATVDLVLPAATYKNILVALTTETGSFVKTSANDMKIAQGAVLKLGDVKGSPAVVIRSGAELKSFLESASTTDAYVVKDLDLTGIELPGAATLSGLFNGLGNSIKNAALNAPLFSVNNGTIKNITLDKSCKVTPDSAIFAALVKSNAGTIENVVNDADVKFESDTEVSTGALFAALAVYNSGKILSCKNNGEVSYVVNAPSAGWGVASICAVNGGQVSDCVNSGKVVSYADYCSEKKIVGKLTFAIVGCTGGLVAYGLEGGTVDGSTNNGDIDYLVRAMNRYVGTTKINRNNVSGIVASPNGDITSCVNNGTVKAYCRCEEGTVSPIEYLLCVGGISGGDYFAKNQLNSNIRQCVNNGTLDVFSNYAKSNNTVGGIVGWPGDEAATEIVTSDCKNHGDINVSGTLKCRVGGIQGGTGNIENCTNDGNIKIASTVDPTSAVGSICGFHSKGHAIVNSNAYGSVKSEASIAACGGLLGQHGNVKNTFGTGCKVNCDISCPNVAGTGLVIGIFAADATKAVTIGTAESPVKVAGKVNGVEITAENYASNLHGSNNFLADKHFVNASFNDDPVLAYAGKVYQIVKLADGKWWMAENLRYIPDGVKVSADGTDVNAEMWYPYTTDGTVCTADKSDAAVNARGYLYRYDLLMGIKEYNDTDLAKFTDANIAADPTIARGICPEGWHIPSAAEYYALCGQGNAPYGTKKTDAVFWDASLATPMATVTKAEAAGWNFSFPGAVAFSNYQKTLIDASKTDQPSYVGNCAMSYYPSSTYHEYKSNGYKFWSMASTFTSANKGKLSLMDCIAYNTSTKAVAGVAVRCVKDNN